MAKTARKGKRLWIGVLLLVAALAGGAAYYLTSLRGSTQASQEPALRTTRARLGELVISATGAGTVVAADEVELGFDSSGKLLELNVQVGDRVKQGDVLARIEDLSARSALASAQATATKASLSLAEAREALDALREGPSAADLAGAQAAVATAEEDLATLKMAATPAELAEAEAALAVAQKAYQDLQDGPSVEDLERAKMDLDKAKNSLWSAQLSRDARAGGQDRVAAQQAEASVLNAELALRAAELDWEAANGPATELELQQANAAMLVAEKQLADLKAGSSVAKIAVSEAQLALAREALVDLLEGTTEDDLTLAEETVRQAELSLEQASLDVQVAQAALDGVALTAPFSGTVMAVSGRVGEQVSASTLLITLSDLDRPQIEIYLDESDMGMIAVGYPVEIVLDALPDQIYTGQVIQMDPALVTVSNVQLIRGRVSLDSDSFSKPQGLMVGMNATVDVIGGKAENAVLVPVEALRDLGDGEYAVFVVEDGTPKLRLVEVGLMDITYAEIRSGLQAGELVSTGMVETQ
ncbi:MAG: efflux RND transporter periplasmic adaptor subunit [Anaerolineae bacterium]